MSHPLFAPFQLRSVTFRQPHRRLAHVRVLLARRFRQRLAPGPSRRRAQGGAGLVMLEASAVVPEGRITPADLGIWKTSTSRPRRASLKFIHSQGARAGIQLAHAGRKASMSRPSPANACSTPQKADGNPSLPAPLRSRPNYAVPQPLDQAGIDAIVRAFAAAAHAPSPPASTSSKSTPPTATCFTNSSRPLANQRTDAYGGSFENRIRLLLQVVDAVRAVWPDHLPLFVRISCHRLG